MHLPLLVRDLAIILALAGAVSFAFARMRLPLVLGYLLSGIVAGPFTPPISLIGDLEGVRVWAELGVIFLMFGLGLEFHFTKILKLGRAEFTTGLFEPAAMFLLGAGGAKILGLSTIDSLFVGAIVSVSSTAVVLKTFEELQITHTKLAQLVFGTLVVEDIVGIIILAAMDGLVNGGKISVADSAIGIMRFVAVVLGASALGRLVVPSVVNAVSRKSSDETLILTLLGLCLSMVVFVVYFGYSAPLGAFLMGSFIGESKFIERIEKLFLPIRNVFGAVFFVSIGMLLNPTEVSQHWKEIIALGALTIFGKTAATATGAWLGRSRKKMALHAGLSMGQLGEFSFIIAGLGLTSGAMSSYLYPTTIAVAVLTTFTTPLLMRLVKNQIK